MIRSFIYKDEVSHKFWTVSVNGCDYRVHHGAVGSTGNRPPGKTFDTPAEAQREADRKIAEKLRKGYAEVAVEGGAEVATPTPATRLLPGQTTRVILRPMLVDEVPFGRLIFYVESEAHALQLKKNGHHVLVQIGAGTATVIGRDGQHSQHNAGLRSAAHLAFYAGLPDCVLDGELMGDGAVEVFDLVYCTDPIEVAPIDPFEHRCRQLQRFFERYAPPAKLFRLLPTAFGHEAKAELAQEGLRTDAEGFIARLLTARYSPGRKSPDVVKLKRTRTFDLVVMDVGVDGKANVVLGAYADAGAYERGEEPIPVGKASTNGKGVFARGDVVEARCQLVTPALRMREPRIVGRRPDKPGPECLLSQLK